MKQIVALSIIDWEFRYQRPQQILVRLSKYYPVTYVNATGRDDFSFSVLNKNLKILYFKGCGYILNHFANTEWIHSIVQFFNKHFIEEDIVFWIDFPLWYPVVECFPKSRVIYNCMDEFEQFGNLISSEKIIQQYEDELLKRADITFVTSQRLFNLKKDKTSKIEILRNAVDFEHFNSAVAKSRLVQNEISNLKDIIGYYGAIAEWFDVELIEYIAERITNPIVLIGNVSIDISRLEKFSHIMFLGEKPYSVLPQYLGYFSVCLIPFKICKLTLSTNPVKLYEYLAAGKPVVSSALPEVMNYDDVCYISYTYSEFVENIKLALVDNNFQKRINKVKCETWDNRVETIKLFLEGGIQNEKNNKSETI